MTEEIDFNRFMRILEDYTSVPMRSAYAQFGLLNPMCEELRMAGYIYDDWTLETLTLLKPLQEIIDYALAWDAERILR